MAKWFWRRRIKCRKFTKIDGGRQTNRRTDIRTDAGQKVSQNITKLSAEVSYKCCKYLFSGVSDEKGTKKKLKKRKMKLEFRQNFQKIIALKNHNTI